MKHSAAVHAEAFCPKKVKSIYYLPESSTEIEVKRGTVMQYSIVSNANMQFPPPELIPSFFCLDNTISQRRQKTII